VQDLINRSQTVTLTDSHSLFQGTQPALPVLQINNRHCEASVALQGAHLLTFKRKQGSELLWLSPNAIFAPGKAIRGGIPVCLPWFGVNQSDPSLPKHGFVRNQSWQLSDIDEAVPDSTRLVFTYQPSTDDLTLFDAAFQAELEMILGDTIELTLTLHNCADHAATFSWALHSYHPVSDLTEVRVQGLDNHTYLDNLQSLQACQQKGDICFHGEVDRVYESVPTTQQISGNPTLQIEGENCDTAIVWNPGADNARRMDDVGELIHQQFICVERGSAFANSWQLSANERKTARLQISEIPSD